MDNTVEKRQITVQVYSIQSIQDNTKPTITEVGITRKSIFQGGPAAECNVSERFEVTTLVHDISGVKNVSLLYIVQDCIGYQVIERYYNKLEMKLIEPVVPNALGRYRTNFSVAWPKPYYSPNRRSHIHRRMYFVISATDSFGNRVVASESAKYPQIIRTCIYQ